MPKHPANLGLHLTARGYLIDLLITRTEPHIDQHELREVILFLNNLITFDEMSLCCDGCGER
ncbi:hypothetical protein [Vibrio sp. MEBiC08052]|uniref:hypothetical protein n=1 Tax=Vibrio sp. MEBiC08052 TaxID=1761910 RepID=UPI000740676F|nr:hypothetical protein [Vibrio sp. MEBiC08052]KUJ00758.1 hypothetical protein VRK_02600 [Vibrio sp. MEBiC08052]